MRRREFITLLGGAAAWPLGVRAQQGGMPTIGLLWPADAPPVFPRMESFRQGLRASGLVEGQNVALELRYAQRGPQQLPELAPKLVRMKVDAIFTGGNLAARVAQQATGTIPIVTISDDIIGAGLIASLSRPGGGARYASAGPQRQPQFQPATRHSPEFQNLSDEGAAAVTEVDTKVSRHV